MQVIPNKWKEKERKKKVEVKPIPDSRIENAPPHLTVSRASRSRTLRGVRK